MPGNDFSRECKSEIGTIAPKHQPSLFFIPSTQDFYSFLSPSQKYWDNPDLCHISSHSPMCLTVKEAADVARANHTFLSQLMLKARPWKFSHCPHRWHDRVRMVKKF